MQRGIKAPRAAFVPFPYNFPVGEPGERTRHKEVALAALGLLRGLVRPGEVELPFRWGG